MNIKTEDTNAIEMITQSIVVVRSQRVLLDAELAALYGVRYQGFEPSRETELRSVSRGLPVFA